MYFEEVVDDEGSAETQVLHVLQVIAQEISARMLLSISGYPKVISLGANNTVNLNRGRMHGLKVGMKFEVFHNSGQVIDPDSGRTIALSGEPFNQLEIIELGAESSLARLLQENAPTYGDMTRPLNQVPDPIETAASRRALRIAMGGFQTHGQVEAGRIRPGLIKNIEASIAHALSQQPGLKVVERDPDRLNLLMDQQILADLRKGRKPGMPSGTVSGVDYLVFGDIVSLSIDETTNSFNPMGLKLGNVSPFTAELHAFLYMQDVNSWENSISEEVVIKRPAEPGQALEDVVQPLFAELAKEASKRYVFSIRPLNIISAYEDRVVLNHGQVAGIESGDLFEIFSPGEDVVDPYTGGILQGVGAIVTARVEVIRFLPQGYAVARLIEGKMPERGFTLRPVSAQKKHTPATEKEGPKNLVMGGILHTPMVAKELGAARLNQTIAEIEAQLKEGLVSDGSVNVMEQEADHLRTILEQRYLISGGEISSSDLMKSVQGADYILYARLLSAHKEKGTSQYSQTLHETLHTPGKLFLQAAVYIQKVDTGETLLYKIVRFHREWDMAADEYSQWANLLHDMMDEVLSATLLTLSPLKVDWVQGDFCGLNHGGSVGLNHGDRVKLYAANGVGGPVCECEIAGFGPTGRAEARLVGGGNVYKGMLVKMDENRETPREKAQRLKMEADKKREISW